MTDNSTLQKRIKEAINKEIPDLLPSILDDTKLASAKETNRVYKRHVFNWYAAGGIALMLAAGVTIFVVTGRQSTDLPQIARYYAPYTSNYYVEVKDPGIFYPQSYEELKSNTSAIVLGTVQDVGVYRKKSDVYYARASFGTYIYTVELNKVYYREGGERIGSKIAVTELAYAWPSVYNGLSVPSYASWSFTPHSARPNDLKPLKSGTQYLFYLSARDQTDCYPLAGSAFGVFTLNEIRQIAQNNNIAGLKKSLSSTKNGVERASILYRICALNAQNEYNLQ